MSLRELSDQRAEAARDAAEMERHNRVKSDFEPDKRCPECGGELYHVSQRVEHGAAMDGDCDRCSDCDYESEPT